MARTNSIRLTAEEFFQLPDPPDGRRYELIHGELVVTPSPIIGHQLAITRVVVLVFAWAEAHGGAVVPAPFDLHLAPDLVLEPDVLWFANGRVPAPDAPRSAWTADLVVEVLSRSTRARDRGVKSRLYYQHGVREYWILDPVACTVEIFHRGESGFELHARGSGDRELVSTLSDELRVVPAWIFKDPSR